MLGLVWGQSRCVGKIVHPKKKKSSEPVLDVLEMFWIFLTNLKIGSYIGEKRDGSESKGPVGGLGVPIGDSES